jgi:hypothetical protein
LPTERARDIVQVMMIGIFLVLFGALLLLDHLNVIDIRIGRIMLPVLFIALGASMIFRRRSKPKSS